jgi:hypothetical protein
VGKTTSVILLMHLCHAHIPRGLKPGTHQDRSSVLVRWHRLFVNLPSLRVSEGYDYMILPSEHVRERGNWMRGTSNIEGRNTEFVRIKKPVVMSSHQASHSLGVTYFKSLPRFIYLLRPSKLRRSCECDRRTFFHLVFHRSQEGRS